MYKCIEAVLVKIGEVIRMLRNGKDMTQEEMAARMGKSVQLLREIEKGNVNFKIDTLLAICEALEITPDMLLLGRYIDSDDRLF